MPFGENSAQSPNLVFRWLVVGFLDEDSTPHVALKVWLAMLFSKLGEPVIWTWGRGRGCNFFASKTSSLSSTSKMISATAQTSSPKVEAGIHHVMRDVILYPATTITANSGSLEAGETGVFSPLQN
jgi:hypothetical protein